MPVLLVGYNNLLSSANHRGRHFLTESRHIITGFYWRARYYGLWDTFASFHSFAERVSKFVIHLYSARYVCSLWLTAVVLFERESKPNVRNDCHLEYVQCSTMPTSNIHNIYIDRRNACRLRYHRQQPHFRRLLEGKLQGLDLVSFRMLGANRLSRVTNLPS